MLEEIIKSTLALSNITISKETLYLVIVLVVAIVVVKVIDDIKFHKYYNDMKNEKNKEI